MPRTDLSDSRARWRSGDVRALRILLPLCLTPTHPALLGRGSSAGDVRIEHPFAAPSGGGTGTVYLAQLSNVGTRPERLLGASTPVAEHVLLQLSMRDGAQQRRQTVSAFDLAPGAELRMLPGRGTHLRLAGLKRALRDGDVFDLALRFERAGVVDVRVVVQQQR